MGTNFNPPGLPGIADIGELSGTTNGNLFVASTHQPVFPLFPWDPSIEAGPNPVAEWKDAGNSTNLAQGYEIAGFSGTDFTDGHGKTSYADRMAAASPDTFFYHVTVQTDVGTFPDYNHVYEYSAGKYSTYEIPHPGIANPAPPPVVVSSGGILAAAALSPSTAQPTVVPLHQAQPSLQANTSMPTSTSSEPGADEAMLFGRCWWRNHRRVCMSSPGAMQSDSSIDSKVQVHDMAVVKTHDKATA